MDRKIVKVSAVENYFSLTWKLTNRCNYDCMYCPTKWHDSTSKHHSLDTLKQTWGGIYSKTAESSRKYKISFTGGEVTSSRSFLPFLRWLREEHSDKIHQILVTTNGSANARYYLRLFEYVDNISFSMHSEHIVESEFFNMISELKTMASPIKFIHVNIMDEFWNRERIKGYVDRLTTLGVSHTVNEVNYSMQTRAIPIIKGKLDLDF